MERTRNSLPIFLLISAALLLFALAAIPAIQALPRTQTPTLPRPPVEAPAPPVSDHALPEPLPRLSEHALDKHGQDAVDSWNWINNHGKYCKWDDCPDSRTHYGCEMPDGRYAVAVVIEGISTATAFIVADRGASNRFNDGCTNPWMHVHP